MHKNQVKLEKCNNKNNDDQNLLIEYFTDLID